MPRLLPRLLKALQQTQLTSKHVRTQNVGPSKRKSLYRPVPALPSFNPGGRTRSILLDENPMTDKRAFARHKRLPPRVWIGPRPVICDEYDVPKEMTTQEREWWSSPYLRMLAAPLRYCTASKRHLPNEFLIRLAVLRTPPTTQNSRSIHVLMPDGLEHPRYKRRKARIAVYVTCWKRAVETMKSPVSLPKHNEKIFFSKSLCLHLGYLLRLRILQELEVLTDTLKRNRGQDGLDCDADPTILRRLTRSEFKTLRETGAIPYSGAVAVFVVPPANRDPKTKLRPQPSREPEIPSTEPVTSLEPSYKKVLPPLSNLYHMTIPEGVSEQGTESPLETLLLPNGCVPLYNGVTMFPSPSHRAGLHKLLTELLDVERQFRGTCPGTTTLNREERVRAKGDAKASHAFLLLSNEQTVKRADSAALAIALWRLRMWEGDAFVDKVEGWEIGKDWRVERTDLMKTSH